jgi:MFS transporter, DHA1 family, multidrug resistance protein
LALLLLLAAINALGSLATHMVVPALPAIAIDLGSTRAATQFIVTVYLVALGIGQLACGPLADRFGFRPLVLSGIVLFMAGSLLGAQAGTLSGIVAARAVQALGASACLVASRTMASLGGDPAAAVSRLAVLMMVSLVSPTIAPLVGGAIASSVGWRVIFDALAVAALLVGAVAALRLVERERRRSTGLPSTEFLRLARNRRFVRSVGVVALASAALQTFIVTVPFELSRVYQMDPNAIARCLAGMAVASAGGALLIRRIRRPALTIRIGAIAMITAGSTCVALDLLSIASVWPLLAAMATLGFGVGSALPAALGTAIRAGGDAAGTATSLTGAAQMLLAGLVASAVAQLHLETLAAIGLAVAALASLALLLASRTGE